MLIGMLPFGVPGERFLSSRSWSSRAEPQCLLGADLAALLSLEVAAAALYHQGFYVFLHPSFPIPNPDPNLNT